MPYSSTWKPGRDQNRVGLIIDISPLVSIELRRDSFRLIVDYDDPFPIDPEYRYEEAGALLAALTKVTKSDRYLDYMGKVLNAKSQ